MNRLPENIQDLLAECEQRANKIKNNPELRRVLFEKLVARVLSGDSFNEPQP